LASGTTPSIATASGIAVPSTCASVTTKYTKSVSAGYDYYTRRTTSTQSTYLRLWWPPAAWSPRPVQRSQTGEGVRTPQLLDTGLLHQPLHRALRLPRTDRWISYIVQLR
jgi:hypothetical protein